MSKNAHNKGLFHCAAQKAASWTGTGYAFGMAAGLVVVWAMTGPLFGYSDTWQLVINTGTTVITFLMVFLIQNTQNRDTRAMQLKLDELIRATQGAHLALLDLEELSEEELAAIHEKYLKLASEARKNLRHKGIDTDSPEISLEVDGAKVKKSATIRKKAPSKATKRSRSKGTKA